MPSSPQSPYRNRLLLALSARDIALLQPNLESVEFAAKRVFDAPNQPIQHLYFFERGFASVVADGHGSDSREVGLIGREGVSGVPVLMGTDRSPNGTYAQAAGAARRIEAKPLRDAMEARPVLRKVLLNFAHVFLVQTAQTALANSRAGIEARLARWLLMGHDRINGDTLPLTHEFLSIMLGVRRAGVTGAVNGLEVRGLVHGRRGSIAIVDRAGLEKAAGSSYGIPEAEYRRLLG